MKSTEDEKQRRYVTGERSHWRRSEEKMKEEMVAFPFFYIWVKMLVGYKLGHVIKMMSCVPSSIIRVYMLLKLDNMSTNVSKVMAMICNHVNDVQTFEKDNKIIRATMLSCGKHNLQEEKVKSHQEGNGDRDRKATRISIASIKRTVEFDDAIQAERDFLAIIGAKNPW
ncbi:hypothetical protein H5410_032627 [Solanum commersonii]|uniref:Uncharacterized protein n=1 Tax=Solanum commersonii TaxID=4109 RepID=A0A9J5YLK0_SOLCO|nr:hypothetical protein H5410_032627 [Solanum commersonii]